MTEDQLHGVVAQYLKLALPDDAVFHHSPNGMGRLGWRSKVKLSKFGMKTGWPDIQIVHRGRLFLIELKAPGRREGNRMTGRGYCTKEQRECHADLKRAGAEVITAWSLEEVQTALHQWGIVEREMA